MNRRRFLAGLGGGTCLSLGAVAAQERSPGAADPLPNPAIAGQRRAVVTPADNAEPVKDVERKLKCTCGCSLDIFTCRTTDFSCTLSPALHQEVLALFAAGKNPDQIIEAFVERHGEQILMAPPPRGFNVLGYVVPGIAVLLAGALLALVLVFRRRRLEPIASQIAASAPDAGRQSDPTPDELERVNAALREIS